MGRSPCCSKVGLNRGAWSFQEDKILTDYIKAHGEGKWRNLPKKAGLKRCGKSCRLRWLNYLRPGIKRGNISPDEEELIIRLHKLLGNRWALIAGRLPGRTDNEIKNYWNTNLGKKIQGNQNLAHARRCSSIPEGKKFGKKMECSELSPGPVASPSKTASYAVRAKAFKCSKVIMDPPPRVTKHCDTKIVTTPSMDGGRPSPYNGPSSMFDSGERVPRDLMEFDMGDLCSSDFQFLDLSRNELSPSSDQPATLWEEMLQEWTTADCDQPFVATSLNPCTSFLDLGSDEWQGQ